MACGRRRVLEGNEHYLIQEQLAQINGHIEFYSGADTVAFRTGESQENAVTMETSQLNGQLELNCGLRMPGAQYPCRYSTLL